MTSRVAVILMLLVAVACGRAQSGRKSKFSLGEFHNSERAGGLKPRLPEVLVPSTCRYPNACNLQLKLAKT